MRSRMPLLTSIAVVILSVMVLTFVGFNIAPSKAQKRNNSGAKTGAPKGQMSASTGLTIKKSDHLGPQNVARTAGIKFDKTLKDATGKARRIQIDKVEYLKTPGIRYFARVDGQSREITYLDLKSAKVRLVNIEGTAPAHNFVHILSAAINADSYWTGNTMLEETVHIQGTRNATAFALPQSKTDELSFALRTIDPIHIADLKPTQVFSDDSGGGVTPAEPIKPPDWGNIFPPIEILFRCRINSKYLKHCGEACDMQAPAEDLDAWGSVGISQRKMCKDQSGCLWCGGVCCKSAECSSDTNREPMLDCTLIAGS
jgi:hypothetical protein